MATSLLIKNARYVVTCDDQDRLLENSNLFIEDGVIRSIGQETKNAAKTIDASNMCVYPGLINTHHHMYQCFSRNLPKVQNLELFDWLNGLYAIWENLTEEIIYYSSMTAMGELLKTGCTTIMDHHYVFPKNSGNFIDMQFKAATDLGARFYATRGSMDLGVKDGALPYDSVVQTMDVILNDSQRLIDTYHDPAPYAMRQVGLAPCAHFNASAELMKESAALARKHGVRLHTHLAETLDEERYTIETFGKRPLEYMEDIGYFGPDVWYAHGIYFTDEELKRLAEAGAGVAHCPISNMKLSSGIAKIPQMLELGVPVGLAVDGSASNDGSSLLEEIRVAFLLHRLNSSKQAPSGYDILKIATRGSASLLGRSADLGQLAEGYAGDLFMIGLDKISLVGADFDPKSMLGTVGYKGNVDYTVVNGKVVVENGNLNNLDEKKLVQEATSAVKEYVNRAN